MDLLVGIVDRLTADERSREDVGAFVVRGDEDVDARREARIGRRRGAVDAARGDRVVVQDDEEAVDLGGEGGEADRRSNAALPVEGFRAAPPEIPEGDRQIEHDDERTPARVIRHPARERHRAQQEEGGNHKDLHRSLRPRIGCTPDKEQCSAVAIRAFTQS